MASVHPRKNASGEVSYFQVKWRDGGTRDGAWQSERFDTAEAAEVFKAAVDEAGQHWPPGWVKGKGLIAVDTPDESAYRFRAYATRRIELRTGIEEQTRKAYLQELDSWIFPTFGECDVRSAAHFSEDTIAGWVRRLEQTKVRRGRMPDGSPKMRPMSPKTIRNLHGLLSSILKAAVRQELRATNPCEETSLPEADDETEDDIEFLTPQEVAGLIPCFTHRKDQLLVTVKYGTGMRWGEITALQPQDILDARTGKPRLRVQRAWKKDGNGGYYMGRPKTKRSRRTIGISPTVLDALVELGLHRLDRDELFFTGEQRNQRLHYSTFGDRWARAVKKATEAGVLNGKAPTPHDLRHSHASALIAGGHPLTYIQRRLGHESITTTSDLYGHLLPELEGDALETIEKALAGERPALRVVS